jgi:hypothetical protein
MAAVADGLRAARADEALIAEQQQIEVDLAELLDALKQASRPSSNVSTGQCMGCQGNLNKLLAEVKMLRWMEQSLQFRTARVDGQELSDAQRQSDAAPLAERQREIRDITRRISETFAAPAGN